MTPATISAPLRRLRRRERALAAAWGAARCLCVIGSALAVACLVDWWVDRRRDTPQFVRVGLLAGQVAIGAVALVVWVVLPVFRRRPDDEVALFVESKRPELGQRLISAVQLNRPSADNFGMSAQLIGRVTEEATRVANTIDFPALADHRRLRWAGYVAGGVLLSAAVTLAAAPRTVTALVRRQMLADVPVPRRVTLADRTSPVQPAAEPVTLRFAVSGTGPYAGEVRVAPEDGPAERVAVVTEPTDGLIPVQLAAPAGDFSYEAWLGDGRLGAPGRVKLVPRPAVIELSAALVLPTFVGRRPDGSPYETPQPRGELSGILGCSARVIVQTQKPVARAALELFGAGDPHSAAPPRVNRTLSMKLNDTGTAAETSFELHEDETAYRVVVWDEHDFCNLDPPRRDIRLVAEEPPVVTLLPEQFRPDGVPGSGEDFEVEGVPVPLGGAVRVGYTATHPYGLGRAFLVYRVVAGRPRVPEDGSASDLSPRPVDEHWQRLPLTEVPATEQSGAFDPRKGAFANSRPEETVQFHAGHSADPATRPGRLDGGGRLDFQTRGLNGLRIGDTVEYFVEVTNRDPERPLAGRSETRAKKIVTVAELMAWIDATLRQEDRIRHLADRQRGVFDR